MSVIHKPKVSTENRLEKFKPATTTSDMNLSVIACSHRRHGRDKTVLSRPRRRREQAIQVACLCRRQKLLAERKVRTKHVAEIVIEFRTVCHGHKSPVGVWSPTFD